MRRAIRADRYVAGSRFLVRSWESAGWLPGSAAVDVVPYGSPTEATIVAPRAELLPLPLRFGFIGALMPHKGAHVAVEAFRTVPRTAASLRLWGDPSPDPAYVETLRVVAREADVRIEGAFAEDEKGRVFSEMDVLVVPSTGLESYGLVVDEAMVHGVPVVASRLGALPERFDETCGAFFEVGDAGGLREVVRRLVARPETVAEWRRAIPPVKSMRDASGRIEEIYAGLFAGGVPR
jgi:glycosyltransferase involved in cell wall biosynthesis